jgi:hypothetical protein
MYSPLQKQFFEKCIQAHNQKSNFAKEIGELLNLEKSAVYKRINGDTLMRLEEFILLSKHFDVSLLDIVERLPGELPFRFSALRRREPTPVTFAQGLWRSVSALPLGHSHVYYSTEEIPIFYYLYFEALSLFKFYSWGRTVWELPQLTDAPFSVESMRPMSGRDTWLLLIETRKRYIRIPSTEFWTLHIFDNTLMSILHHYRAGRFTKPEEAFLLLDELRELTRYMEKMAENGRKGWSHTEGATFNLFHNESMHTSNTFLAEVNGVPQSVYTTFAHPNFLRNQTPDFCQYSAHWYEQLRKHAIPMSGSAERFRSEYFQKIRLRIDNVGKELSSVVWA